jgi:enoyl-CoA hydratase/carnithine racemase
MTVRFQVDGALARLTLADHKARNVLTPAALRDLGAGLASAAADDSVRVVVLTGEGTTFCAGASLSEASDSDEDRGSGARLMVGLLEAMLTHPKPIVGRIQGHVAGGGNGLVACCDLSVAAASATFAFSEVRVGVAPAIISVPCLARMNPADARELLLTGERVSAERVARAGLVTSVAADEHLDSAVTALVDKLLLGGPTALARTKELLRRVPGLDRAAAFDWAAGLSAELFGSAEAHEGMSAFRERRLPAWAPSGGQG